jgi:hypothetical protein
MDWWKVSHITPSLMVIDDLYIISIGVNPFENNAVLMRIEYVPSIAFQAHAYRPQFVPDTA